MDIKIILLILLIGIASFISGLNLGYSLDHQSNSIDNWGTAYDTITPRHMVTVEDIAANFLFPHEEERFISSCNKRYGKPAWNKATYSILPVDDYTSYSHAFYIEHEFITIGGLLDGDMYYCEGINN